METSGYCNLKCTFCPCGDDDSGIIKDIMSEETFDLFIKQCQAFPNNIKILRIIGIGEPMINNKIAIFVKKAKESKKFDKVEITTNAILLNEELSNDLVNSGLDTLLVSLESLTNEGYKKVSRTDVDVDRLFDNLKYFYENRKQCKLYIKTVDATITSENDKKYFIDKFGDIADEIQIEHVYENWPEFNAGTTGNNIRFDLEEWKKEKKVCVQPFKLMCLAANGDVMPCSVDWKRKLKLGNIHKESLHSIWNGDKMNNLRLSLLRCEKNKYCNVCHVTKSNQPDDIDEYADKIIARLER